MVTDTQTDTQTKYRNPRCACAPRVKNGTCGTGDYRYFSGFPFLLSLLAYITFAFTESAFFYHIFSFFTLVYLGIVLICQPFKQLRHNFIASVMVSALLLGCMSMIIKNVDSSSYEYSSASLILLSAAQCLPFICPLGLACLKLMCNERQPR